jgi:hypothetical protein
VNSIRIRRAPERASIPCGLSPVRPIGTICNPCAPLYRPGLEPREQSEGRAAEREGLAPDAESEPSVPRTRGARGSRRALASGGSLSDEEIARELEIDQAGLDRLLEEMAERGLIRMRESGSVTETR